MDLTKVVLYLADLCSQNNFGKKIAKSNKHNPLRDFSEVLFRRMFVIRKSFSRSPLPAIPPPPSPQNKTAAPAGRGGGLLLLEESAGSGGLTQQFGNLVF